MRPGVREFRDASLKVAMATGLPEHMQEQTREITHLYVKPESRRLKLATALLNFVCQEADANRVTLVLTARDYDNDTGEPTPHPDESQLVAWYQRFGFTVLQDTPKGTFMARQVREKTRVLPLTAAIKRALH